MKRILIYSACFLALAGAIASCKKKLENDYLNPESTTTGSLGKLFTGMLTNRRIHPTYWDYATFVTGVTGKYSQFLGVITDKQMYVASVGYNGDRWSDYYAGSPSDPNNPSARDGAGVVSQYREMIKNYNKLSATEQANQYVFVQLAKVVYYDQTAQMIDLWGDIPFTQAGALDASNTLSYAKYEDAASIYDTLINGLKDLNTWLASASLSTSTSATLGKQDILLGGNLASWRRYVNSLRLRLLIRISYVKETSAKAEITAMLNAPATYPMVDDNSQNILLKEAPTSFTSDLRTGITDGASSNGPYASAYMLDTVMVANNDPRTDVFWDKGSSNASYQGLSAATNSSTQSAQISANLIATFDSATFIYNSNIPGVLFTAAEVSLLKAEAYERWGLGTAATAYANGITQSVNFYYSLNQSKVLWSGAPGNWAPLATPSSTVINAYIAGANIAYAGTSAQKLAKIATQNWLNFFLLQAGQAWAEVRRTNYPVLNFATDAGYPSAPLPPTRVLYPETETVYNADNYSAVKAKDTRTTKIFWDVN